ncbi:MAG: kynureninase [Thermoanaerobaculia bacterium]|nr:kynureninase [Thermoanaerobaculia bacterium]
MSSHDAEVRRRDAADPLAPARARFRIPDGRIYLDGNSLGALPAEAGARMTAAIEREWGDGLVASWNDAGWYELPLALGDRVGGLVGAAAGQVAVCDTTTLNLFKALHAALGLRPERRVVVMEEADFPANLYIAEGVLGSAGRPLERRLVPRGEDPAGALDETVAVLALSHVNYRGGARHDLEALTRAAHQAGALAVWDLCHSAGALPVELDAAGADFAVGCTYKYLNGGPGAPAWIYAARRHLADARQPLTGWMGHGAPFEFEPGYRPDPGIRRFLCGTPHILSMRAAEAGLATFEGVSMREVEAKAASLTSLFIERVEDLAGADAPPLVSPRAPERRGAQVSFAHDDGYAVVQAMIRRGVVGDFRAPDVMRFGFAPLYLTHSDAARAAEVLVECLDPAVWRDPRHARHATVT